MRVIAAIALAFSFLTATAQAKVLELHRGVGVHEWLNWSPVNGDGTYIWPPYRAEQEWLDSFRKGAASQGENEFQRIRSMGFDFVRLSVDPGPLVSSEGPKRKEALAILSKAAKRITDSGLRVVFDLHGVNQVPATSMKLIYDGADSEGVSRYRAMVKEVARMLVKVGTDKVAIEPYNEPAYYPCDASGTDDWQRIMEATVADIRSVSGDLTIIATGACGGGVKGLLNLKPGFDDPNIYYSFHMYEPHDFTHQRSETKGGFASGMPWPASTSTPEAVRKALEARMDAAGISRAEKRANLAEADSLIAKYFAEDWSEKQLDARFEQALGWAKTNAIPSERLFMGEFGAILMTADGRSGADDADRIRYLTAVRRSAEKSGIPWSIWEYANSYGMSVIPPKGNAVPDMGMLGALGLMRQ
ncbi:glycoside hydrolase family 5 protein [Tianweitania sp.]|uniref:glycoside hydrolase family 5 protein n=1 Tax=Tianweitania sp. TaxID=2021634 RepID=UPI002896C271|nr:cellulase family glycosylhydrolase [Tianweitania sp.]